MAGGGTDGDEEMEMDREWLFGGRRTAEWEWWNALCFELCAATKSGSGRATGDLMDRSSSSPSSELNPLNIGLECGFKVRLPTGFLLAVGEMAARAICSLMLLSWSWCLGAACFLFLDFFELGVVTMDRSLAAEILHNFPDL